MKEPEKDARTVAKHSLWIRWTHWINFPLLALMTWSGILIYWANDVYRPFFPETLYRWFHLDHRLAFGMAVHFTLMWPFVLNGLAYVGYLAFSGEWRESLPDRRSWNDALRVAAHDLGLVDHAPPQGKFNAAQKIAYTAVVFQSVGLVLSGFAIYKPTQLHWLTSCFGGYAGARLTHFILMLSVVGFFGVHVAQVARAGLRNFSAIITGFEVTRDNFRPARRRILLSAGVTLLSAFTGAWAWRRLVGGPNARELPARLRAVLEADGRLAERAASPDREAPAPEAPPAGTRPRTNGDVGLASDDDDLLAWRLEVPRADAAALSLSLAELRGLPRTQATELFKCIEGWSRPLTYAGVRFTDFLAAYRLGQRADGTYYRYVGLVTPDEEYYVSIDMKSMLQRQVVLAYEMNGAPLRPENGAPLRLIVPNKYGIKNLKRVGRIFFSDTRPPDYWEERGYDWFAGL